MKNNRLFVLVILSTLFTFNQMARAEWIKGKFFYNTSDAEFNQVIIGMQKRSKKFHALHNMLQNSSRQFEVNIISLENGYQLAERIYGVDDALVYGLVVNGETQVKPPRNNTTIIYITREAGKPLNEFAIAQEMFHAAQDLYYYEKGLYQDRGSFAQEIEGEIATILFGYPLQAENVTGTPSVTSKIFSLASVSRLVSDLTNYGFFTEASTLENFNNDIPIMMSHFNELYDRPEEFRQNISFSSFHILNDLYNNPKVHEENTLNFFINGKPQLTIAVYGQFVGARLIDLHGNILTTSNKTIVEGHNIGMSDVEPGVYMVEIITEAATFSSPRKIAVIE